MESTNNLPFGELISLIIFWIFLYAYFCYCLQVIAEKTKTKKKWMAWIPILNLYFLCKIDERPTTWVILLFVPGVNFYIWIKLWMDIAEELGKPIWLGTLMIFPPFNLIALGYLAFSSPGISSGISA